MTTLSLFALCPLSIRENKGGVTAVVGSFSGENQEAWLQCGGNFRKYKPSRMEGTGNFFHLVNGIAARQWHVADVFAEILGKLLGFSFAVNKEVFQVEQGVHADM